MACVVCGDGTACGTLPVEAQILTVLGCESALLVSVGKGLLAVEKLRAIALENVVGVAAEAAGADSVVAVVCPGWKNLLCHVRCGRGF